MIVALAGAVAATLPCTDVPLVSVSADGTLDGALPDGPFALEVDPDLPAEGILALYTALHEAGAEPWWFAGAEADCANVLIQIRPDPAAAPVAMRADRTWSWLLEPPTWVQVAEPLDPSKGGLVGGALPQRSRELREVDAAELKIKRRSQPVAPEEARAWEVGVLACPVSVFFDDGVVYDIRAKRCEPRLREAAVEAVRGWRFKVPKALRDGRITTDVTLRFETGDASR